MVAALQLPLDDYDYDAHRFAPARVIPLRPEHVHRGHDHRGHVHQVPVHRQPSPRVARSLGAAVYWRRRLFAAALGLGVLLTAAHAGAALGGTTTAPERSPHVERVVVQQGDTLWSLAERLAPHDDPRAVVDSLTSSLGTSSLRPGQTITWSK